MSVPKDKRDEGELAVNTVARSICVHILNITGNEKNFPVTQSHYITMMQDLAIQIDLDCWKANNILVGDSERYYRDRLELQDKAAGECTDMLELINIAKPLFHMNSKRYKYLTTQYAKLRKMIRAWHKSDQGRLKP